MLFEKSVRRLFFFLSSLKREESKRRRTAFSSHTKSTSASISETLIYKGFGDTFRQIGMARQPHRIRSLVSDVVAGADLHGSSLPMDDQGSLRIRAEPWESADVEQVRRVPAKDHPKTVSLKTKDKNAYFLRAHTGSTRSLRSCTHEMPAPIRSNPAASQCKSAYK